jgi:hypothetical protein
MGNTSSSTNKSSSETNDSTQSNDLKPKAIGQIIDYIATHYILTMNFESLKKLAEVEYCNKLVVLTSEIIEKNFIPLEISYLAQRTKNGVEINELEKDKVVFLNKDTLNDMDLQNPLKKKRVCIGIAKFYILIAHIFAAIVTTINPVYTYKDAMGNTVKASLYDKNKIPPNVARQIYKMNICQQRIDALKRGQDYTKFDGSNSNSNSNSNDTNNNDEITVHPDICAFNLNVNGNVKNLSEEPGIAELMKLYYDDKYDYLTGQFTGMSEETKKDYEEDLRIFYNVFTGNNEDKLPDNIHSFADIRLRDYKSNKDCQGTNAPLNSSIKGKLSNKLFAEYAANIRKMIQHTNENQEGLLSVINKLFTYSINPQTQQKQIRVNPELNEDNIHKVMLETRAIIMKLYLTCEMDYTNGIKIYEAIVEQKILESAQSQIKILDKLSESLSFEK